VVRLSFALLQVLPALRPQVSYQTACVGVGVWSQRVLAATNSPFFGL
jgi:hypothetical protein